MKHAMKMAAGCRVRASDGKVGTVRQFYFDDLTWSIRYMAVETDDQLQGRTVLILPAAMGKPDWMSRVFPVNLTKEQVLRSPSIAVGKPVSRRYEDTVLDYYDWPPYWSGGFYMLPGYGMKMASYHEEAPNEKESAVGEQTPDPHLRGTQEVTGYRIHATDGEIGHVEDFIVDDESWRIHYLVVDTRNWLPGRRVLVSPQWIREVSWDDAEVVVDLARNAIKKSPEYDPAKPISLDYELKLRDHLSKPHDSVWVCFKLHAPRKARVCVAGTFNNWNRSGIRLVGDKTGTYTASILLPAGKYEYKFIVNGEWRDGSDCHERVANPFGTTNSVLMVESPIEHDGHAHTFSRLSVGHTHPMWSTPMGG